MKYTQINFFKKIAAVITVVFILFAIGGTQTFACSVGPDWPLSGEENFNRSDVVFVGTVTDVVREGDINGSITITFDLEELYKGTVNGVVEVQTGGNSAMCGYDDMGIFSEGSVWSIYASNDLYTTSVASNKKYDSVAKAVKELDSFAGINNQGGEENEPTMCIDLYQPVCGQIDTGIRCVTTPCPSSEEKTFSNSCYLQQAKAVYLYDGECKEPQLPENPLPPVQNTIPDNCQSWYDGCNWCTRSEPGGPAMCTLRACFQQEASYCNATFAKPNQDTNPAPTNNGDVTVTTSEEVVNEYPAIIQDETSIYEIKTDDSVTIFTSFRSFFKTLSNFFKNLF